MSSLEIIYQKMGPGLDPAALSQPASRMSPEVAHDLNNILTIIQGYAERMMMKHGDNAALRPDLQIIAENAKRAAIVVRQAAPRQSSPQPTVMARRPQTGGI